MSFFLTKLRVEEIDDGRWRLLSKLVYVSSLAGVIEVPAGFETDFASVPRVPVAYWLFGDVAHEAAVIHDFLYSTGAVPRAMADGVLLEAMEITGIPHWRRLPIYWAVRMGGASHYTTKQLTEERQQS